MCSLWHEIGLLDFSPLDKFILSTWPKIQFNNYNQYVIIKISGELINTKAEFTQYSQLSD
jgi:hypothetical protein